MHVEGRTTSVYSTWVQDGDSYLQVRAVTLQGWVSGCTPGATYTITGSLRQSTTTVGNAGRSGDGSFVCGSDGRATPRLAVGAREAALGSGSAVASLTIRDGAGHQATTTRAVTVRTAPTVHLDGRTSPVTAYPSPYGDGTESAVLVTGRVAGCRRGQAYYANISLTQDGVRLLAIGPLGIGEFVCGSNWHAVVPVPYASGVEGVPHSGSVQATFELYDIGGSQLLAQTSRTLVVPGAAAAA